MRPKLNRINAVVKRGIYKDGEIEIEIGKTLKDIKNYYGDFGQEEKIMKNFNVDIEQASEIAHVLNHFYEDARDEAKKWTESLDYKCFTESDEIKCKRAIKWWIDNFFDITEEDLK